MEKGSLQRQEKKLKRPHSGEKAPNSPEFIDSREEEEKELSKEKVERRKKKSKVFLILGRRVKFDIQEKCGKGSFY